MDKQNLYYIVIEGTDCRVLNGSGCPIMFLPEVVDDFVDKANSPFAKHSYVKTSVDEYERTFTEILEY